MKSTPPRGTATAWFAKNFLFQLIALLCLGGALPLVENVRACGTCSEEKIELKIYYSCFAAYGESLGLTIQVKADSTPFVKSGTFVGVLESGVVPVKVSSKGFVLSATPNRSVTENWVQFDLPCGVTHVSFAGKTLKLPKDDWDQEVEPLVSSSSGAGGNSYFSVTLYANPGEARRYVFFLFDGDLSVVDQVGGGLRGYVQFHYGNDSGAPGLGAGGGPGF